MKVLGYDLKGRVSPARRWNRSRLGIQQGFTVRKCSIVSAETGHATLTCPSGTDPFLITLQPRDQQFPLVVQLRGKIAMKTKKEFVLG